MADTELFLSLAEIAGVFVGFGALIAVRSSGPTEPLVVAPMRAVVSMGALTIVAALAPVTVGRFDLTGHQVWALSSAVVLVGWFVLVAAMARTPEYSWTAAAEYDRGRLRWVVIAETVVYVLYMISSLVLPIVIVLGVVPDLEAALYSALVVLILLGAGWTLLELVFQQRVPASG